MIFFNTHSFKLAYLVFTLLVVYLYFFISRNYFQSYETSANGNGKAKSFLKGKELSSREMDVAILLIEGQTNLDIGEKLFISINTVKTHIKSIYKKLNVKTRVQLLYLIRNSAISGLPDSVRK
jgi:DNA-binding NarL/FixJ family response regulator